MIGAIAAGIGGIASLIGGRKKRPSYAQTQAASAKANVKTFKEEILPMMLDKTPTMEAMEANVAGVRGQRLPAWAAQMQRASMGQGLDIGREYAPQYADFRREFGTLGQREDLMSKIRQQTEGLDAPSPLIQQLTAQSSERLRGRTRGEERDLAQRAYSSGRRIDPAVFGAMQRLSSDDMSQRMGEATNVARLGDMSRAQSMQDLIRAGGAYQALGEDPMQYAGLGQGYSLLPTAISGGQRAVGSLAGVGQTGAGVAYGLAQQRARAAEGGFLDRLSGGISAGQNIGKALGGLFTPKPMYGGAPMGTQYNPVTDSSVSPAFSGLDYNPY